MVFCQVPQREVPGLNSVSRPYPGIARPRRAELTVSMLGAPGRRRTFAAVAWLGCVVVACVALWRLTGDDVGAPIFLLFGANASLGVALAALRGTLDPIQWSEYWWAVIGPGVVALGTQLVVGCALFPVTLTEQRKPDLTWFPAVAVVVLALGTLGFMLAVLVMTMVVGPLVALVLRFPAAVAGVHTARETVLISLFLLVLAAFATALGPVVPGPRFGATGRAVLILLGLGEPIPDSPEAMLWLARAQGVVLVALMALVVRPERGRRSWVKLPRDIGPGQGPQE